MGSYASLAVRDAAGNITGYRSTSTGQIVETTGAASPAFQAAQSAYQSQHYATLSSSGVYAQSTPVTPSSSVDTSSAAAIVANIYGGVAPTSYLAESASREGLQNMRVAVNVGGVTTSVPYEYAKANPSVWSDVPAGINTVKVYSKAEQAQNALPATMTALMMAKVSANQGGTLTLLGPGIGPMGTNINKNVKVAVDVKTGEIAEYSPDAWGNYAQIGGVSRYGAQSGEFSVLTDQGQLINLETISPFATENLSKKAASGANEPWVIPASASALMLMNQTGIIGTIQTGAATTPLDLNAAIGSGKGTIINGVPYSGPSAFNQAPVTPATNLGMLGGLNIVSATVIGTVKPIPQQATGLPATIPSMNQVGGATRFTTIIPSMNQVGGATRFTTTQVGAAEQMILPAPFKSTPTKAAGELGTLNGLTIVSATLMGSVNPTPSYTAPSYGQSLESTIPGPVGITLGVAADILPILGNYITGNQKGLMESVQANPMYPSAKSIQESVSGVSQRTALEDKYSALSSEYSTNLAAFNADKSLYETSLSGYNVELSQYNALKSQFEQGGNTDVEMYNKLVGMQTELTTRQSQLSGYESALNLESTTLKTQGSELTTVSDQLSAPGVQNASWFGVAGDIFEALNIGVSKYTTDTSNAAAFLATTPNIGGTIKGPAPVVGFTYDIDFAKGAYVDFAQHPVTLAASVVGGEVFGLAEQGIAEGVAGAAMRGGGIGTIGKVFSTPLANGLITTAKVGFGGYVVVTSVENIINQPTAYLKGHATGETALEFYGFTKGYEDAFAGWKAPENLYQNVKFSARKSQTPEDIAKGRAQPFTTIIQKNIAAVAYVAKLRMEGRDGEAADFWNTFKLKQAIRFIEPPTTGSVNYIEDLTSVPKEQVGVITRAATETPTVGFGSGATATQAGTSLFADIRLRLFGILTSDAYRNAPDWEKASLIEHPVERGVVLGGRYPVSPGADWDVMGSNELIYKSLASNEGAMVRVKLGENEQGVMQDTWVKGERILKNQFPAKTSGEPATMKDVTGVAYGGKIIEADIHAPGPRYPYFKGSEKLPVEPASSKEEWRTSIITRIFGSPFESVPMSQDIYRVGDVGYSGIENKEKLNFQTQRLGESMAKDLSSLVEERPGDALYRGERFTKDFYRDISNTQALLKVDAARTASGKNLLTEKQRGIANKRIQNMLERDVTWQMSRKDVLFAKERSLETAGMAKEPSPEATAEFIGGLPEDKIAPTGPVKISGRAIMEIGLENLYNVKTVQGNELGVISTGAAPTKKLSEMGKASTRTPQEWLDYRAGINPFTGQHAIPEETNLGSLRSGRVQGASFRTLAEAAEQEGLGKPSSTADRVKQWAEKTGEQPARGYAEPAKDIFEEEFTPPADSEIIHIRSPEPTATGYNYIGVFGVGMFAASQKGGIKSSVPTGDIISGVSTPGKANALYGIYPVGKSYSMLGDYGVKSVVSSELGRYEIYGVGGRSSLPGGITRAIGSQITTPAYVTSPITPVYPVSPKSPTSPVSPLAPVSPIPVPPYVPSTVVPFIPGGALLPGGGGDGSGFMSSRSWTQTHPVGADLMAKFRGKKAFAPAFKPMKFKMPKRM